MKSNSKGEKMQRKCQREPKSQPMTIHNMKSKLLFFAPNNATATQKN